MLTLKHTKPLLILLLGISIFLGACIDRIDFERPQTLEDAIAARSVTLLDDAGNSIDLDTNAEGIYYKIIHDEEPRISIRSDKSYKIQVETFEDLVFESAWQVIIPSPTPTN